MKRINLGSGIFCPACQSETLYKRVDVIFLNKRSAIKKELNLEKYVRTENKNSHEWYHR